VPRSQLVEKLDGDFSRVSLSCIKNDLKSETLARLFLLSSLEPKEDTTSLEARLNVARDMIKEGVLPFSLDEFEEKRAEWRKKGYPALHHSEKFRNEYHPAYRVISNKYVTFLPLFAAIDKKLRDGRVILAIEGGSASGKSTLGEMLRSIYDCTVFHMDDYFLPPEKRTKERLDEVGGNVDYERFDAEILTPLKNGEKAITFRRFDCSTMSLLPPTTVITTPFIVVEGAYSMHPTLSEKYDLSAFLNISPEKQRARIEKRNSPQFARRFFEEWIPLEEKYFSFLSIKEKCDIVIDI
jgi:uridine kinase